jgi:hypothetical protein
MLRNNIEFVDPNLQEDIEEILPAILAQALINKLENDKCMCFNSKKIRTKTA